jgi:hypothetical protein
MKIKVQIIVEHENLEEPNVEDVSYLCRGDLLPETLGLTLQEGKDLLADVLPMQTNDQTVLLITQKVAAKLQKELGEEQVMFAPHSCSFGRLGISRVGSG